VTQETLKSVLWETSERLMGSFELAWLPPTCPECNGMLSQKMASTRLVCLSCGTEFEVVKVADDRGVEEEVR